MRTDDALLTLLRQVRHRLRAQAVLQGGVLGGAIGLSAWAALVPWHGAVAIAVGFAAPAAAVAWAGLRKVPLSRCARVVDESLSGSDPGERRNGDRAFVAVGLLGHEGPFAAAAIADATRAAAGLAPSRAAPWKRPRGLPGLAAAGALALLVAGAGAPRGPAVARRSGGGTRAPAPSAQGGPEVQQRRALADLLRAAADLRPEDVARLASALPAAMQRAAVSDGTPSGGAGEPSARTGGGAPEDGERGGQLRDALARVASALSATESTRRAGEALARLDARAARAALEELAERVETLGAEPRRQTAAALTAAAAAAQAPGTDGKGGGSPPAEPARADERRLARNEQGAPAEGADERQPAASPDRQLRRLERGADQADEERRQEQRASGQPEASGSPEPRPAPGSNQPGGATEQQSDEALGGRSPSRLQRERQTAAGEGAAESRFERAARGEPDQGPAGQGAAAGAMASNGERGGPAGGPSPGPAPGGDRAGADPGGDPLGQRSELAGRGREVQAQVATGEGPSRATVIESGARGGFAQTTYRQVFRDYEAAAEEALDTTAVPLERRTLVRRYFHLIRPR